MMYVPMHKKLWTGFLKFDFFKFLQIFIYLNILKLYSSYSFYPMLLKLDSLCTNAHKFIRQICEILIFIFLNFFKLFK